MGAHPFHDLVILCTRQAALKHLGRTDRLDRQVAAVIGVKVRRVMRNIGLRVHVDDDPVKTGKLGHCRASWLEDQDNRCSSVSIAIMKMASTESD